MCAALSLAGQYRGPIVPHLFSYWDFLLHPLGIQSPCQMMIGVYNHLLSKVFGFHYHSQKVIGSLGIFVLPENINILASSAPRYEYKTLDIQGHLLRRYDWTPRKIQIKHRKHLRRYSPSLDVYRKGTQHFFRSTQESQSLSFSGIPLESKPPSAPKQQNYNHLADSSTPPQKL